MNERIKKLRKSLDLTQQEFADHIGSTQNVLANYESGRRNPSGSVINNICKTFNVSETWLRTGEGEMFVPSPSGVLDALATEYKLPHSEYVLVEKFLELKPEARQAVIDYMHKVVSSIKAGDSSIVPAFIAVPSAGLTEADEQERTQPDIAAEPADLKHQNQELAAKVAAMEEEDIANGLWDRLSASPSASVGEFSPRVKK